MVGAFGGGALAGTLLYGVAHRLPRRLTFLACFVAAPLVGFGTLALTPPLGVVEGVGLVPTIVGMGAIYSVVTLGMFFNPALKQMAAGRGRRN